MNNKRSFRSDRSKFPERADRSERPARTAHNAAQDRNAASQRLDDWVEENQIEGRNAVLEALRAGRPLDKVYIASGNTDAGLSRIAAMAREAGAVVVMADRHRLDQMAVSNAHQGVIAIAAAHEYATLEELLERAEAAGEPPLLVILDEVADPHNLGAVLRTAECAGAHGIIIPKRRSAGLGAVVAKASAGAVEYLPVARVPNLTAAIEALKSRGIWIYGTAADAPADLYHTDLSGPAAIVIGSEGNGMGRLVAESCDYLVSIPMRGHINSLNASAAAAILLYEAVRQRHA